MKRHNSTYSQRCFFFRQPTRPLHKD